MASSAEKLEAAAAHGATGTIDHRTTDLRPALRELLPLKAADQPGYLDWSVGAFRLATAGARTATAVHTHLCYSDFAVVIDAIAALDADVTSIEAAPPCLCAPVRSDIAASLCQAFSSPLGALLAPRSFRASIN